MSDRDEIRSMGEETPPTGADAPSEPLTLARAVRGGRHVVEYLTPSNAESAPAAMAARAAQADDHVTAGIHTAYQAVKKVANDAPAPNVLAVSFVAAAIPSARYGVPVFVRNTVLAVGLTALLIYPDKLAGARAPRA